MLKSNLIYINHIENCISKIEQYTKNISEEQFSKTEIIQDAVIRNFEIIGEATKKLSKDFKDTYFNVPWKDIAGMRDVLIHDYLGVDIDAVWQTVKINIPILKKDIEEIQKDF